MNVISALSPRVRARAQVSFIVISAAVPQRQIPALCGALLDFIRAHAPDDVSITLAGGALLGKARDAGEPPPPPWPPSKGLCCARLCLRPRLHQACTHARGAVSPIATRRRPSQPACATYMPATQPLGIEARRARAVPIPLPAPLSACMHAYMHARMQMSSTMHACTQMSSTM